MSNKILPVMEIFSGRLRKLRLELDKTQQEFADLGGVSLSSYNRYEKGSAEVPFSFVSNLEENIPNLNVQYFFKESANMFTSNIDYSSIRVNEPITEYEETKLRELEDQIEKLWYTVKEKTEDPKARIQNLEAMLSTLGQAIERIPIPEKKNNDS